MHRQSGERADWAKRGSRRERERQEEEIQTSKSIRPAVRPASVGSDTDVRAGGREQSQVFRWLARSLARSLARLIRLSARRQTSDRLRVSLALHARLKIFTFERKFFLSRMAAWLAVGFYSARSSSLPCDPSLPPSLSLLGDTI